MYQAPQSFIDRLESDFQGRLRIRWSIAKGEFHIEEKVGRAALAPFRISDIDDRYIRARDGYHFIMAVKAGTSVPCRICGLKCSVPECRTAEIKCSYCESVKTRRGREFGGYWPLNDTLLEHLRKCDPKNDGHIAAVKSQDLQEVRREMDRKRSMFNTIESATLDDKYQLFDTPFTGYTGKVLPNSTINGKAL